MRVFADLLEFFGRFHRERYGWDGSPIHDAVAVAHLALPGLVTTEACRVDIETHSELTRGRTVADRHHLTGRPANAEIGLAIDRAAFPNTQIAQYWTSSPSAGSSDKAWYIYFTSGWTSFDDKGSRYNVRCVRGSRCYPTSRFVVGSGSSSGLVTDTLTNLVWQQQKSATRMTWTDAQTYCPSGFRLPTVKELESIVDLTVNSGGPSNRPAINQSAFPIPADIFWTSSASASNMPPYVTLAWSVDFSSGSSDDNYIMSNSCWALCVQ